MTTVTQSPTISITALDFYGKARGETFDRSTGYAFTRNMSTYEATIKDIVDFGFWNGGLIYPPVYDIARFELEKSQGKTELQPYTDKRGKKHTPTARRDDYFLGVQLMVVDIDSNLPSGTPAQTISYILENSPELVGRVGAIYPSSSFTSDSPRMHLLFVLDQPITDKEVFATYTKNYAATLPLTTDDHMSVITQPLYGTIFDKGDYAGVPLDESMVYLDCNAVVSVEFLSQIPPAEVSEALHKPEVARQKREANGRADSLRRKGLPAGKAEAKNLLKYILDSGNVSFSVFQSVVGAASPILGDDVVYETIVNHPNYATSSKIESIERIQRDYTTDRHGLKIYSLGTLIYIAMALGYGSSSPVDIDLTDEHVVQVNVEHVTDAFKEWTPYNCLIKSATGTGKTTLLFTLLDRMFPQNAEENAPQKQVLVIAPLKTLVMDICSKIRAVPATDKNGGIVTDDFGRTKSRYPVTMYLTADNMTPKDVAELRKAKILCVTPQTAAKLLGTMQSEQFPVSKYGLVWIEECDQIIKAVVQARTDRPLYTTNQVEGFLNLIKRAFEENVPVWGVDAGLTQVSVEWFKSYTDNLDVLVNQFVPTKAKVQIYGKAEAVVEEVRKAILEGKSVHYITDTKGASTWGTQAIEKMVIAHNERINMMNQRHGTYTPNVLFHVVDADREDNLGFATNINAKLKNIQVLISSPTLKSGADITEWVPDLTAVVYTHLLPRDLLQAINRTRRQNRVIMYAGMNRELRGIDTVNEIKAYNQRARSQMLQTLLLHGRQGAIEPLTYEGTAILREHLQTLDEIDRLAQLQMPETFTIALLKGEGREIETVKTADELAYTDKLLVQKATEAENEFVRNNWPNVPPITHDQKRLAGLSVLQLRQGVTHGHINKVTNGGYRHDENTPAEIYDAVENGGNPEVLEQQIVTDGTNWEINKTAKMLSDVMNKKLTPKDINLDAARRACFATIAHFVVDGELPATRLAEMAADFVGRVDRVRGAYDLCVAKVSRQKCWKEVYDKNDLCATAKALAVNILQLGGLKLQQKMKSTIANPQTGKRLYDYVVTNKDQALQILYWRQRGEAIDVEKQEKVKAVSPLIRMVFKAETEGLDEWYTQEHINSIVLRYDALPRYVQECVLLRLRGTETFEDIMAKYSMPLARLQAMNDEQKHAVETMMLTERTTDFPDAVDSVLRGVRF